MDSVSDLVGVSVVVTMIAWGWSMTRELREVLFPRPVDHDAADEVIVLP